MTDDGDRRITLVEGDDGVLLLGSENALAALDARSEVRSYRLASRTLARVGNAMGAAAAVAATSGRWVKLSAESTKFLADHHVTEVATGVVRGDGGQILKHLTFDKAALLTPAAPAALAAMATQASVEAALADITAYLVVIDAKLDRLLQQRKVEVLGQLGGVTLALEEAHSIYTETGVVSSVTWSKIQANALALQTMQAEAVAQLDAVADEVRRRVGDTDGSARALADARTDVTFWLGVLARSMALQDRQYVLELARVADDEPAQLEAHHRGVRTARADRARRIGRSLDVISASVRESADLSNLDRVANPFSAQQVTRGANGVSESVAEFAAHADLELVASEVLEETPWGRAARALAEDAGSRAGAVRDRAAGRARSLGAQLQERRDDAVLSRAEKVLRKRRPRAGTSPGADAAVDPPTDDG